MCAGCMVYGCFVYPSWFDYVAEPYRHFYLVGSVLRRPLAV